MSATPTRRIEPVGHPLHAVLDSIPGSKSIANRALVCAALADGRRIVDLAVADDGVDISATVRTADRTGIEMEALTAVAVAALTVIDMVKAVDRHARITDVRVTAKSGGRSGDWSEQ